jgi:histidinol-phosphate aminotransferase
MRNAATDILRLYPDREATEVRETLAVHHGVKPEQVFVGNGSDEVLAHAFVALLKQPKPLLFRDVTYSFYPVWAQLFGLACETVPLDGGMRIRVEDYRREAGSIVIANPNAPTG